MFGLLLNAERPTPNAEPRRGRPARGARPVPGILYPVRGVLPHTVAR